MTVIKNRKSLFVQVKVQTVTRVIGVVKLPIHSGVPGEHRGLRAGVKRDVPELQADPQIVEEGRLS